MLENVVASQSSSTTLVHTKKKKRMPEKRSSVELQPDDLYILALSFFNKI
jgi:hypothetical protein